MSRQGDWAQYDTTPCGRCGVPGEEVNHTGTCKYCQVEIREGIAWPWMISKECLNLIVKFSAQDA